MSGIAGIINFDGRPVGPDDIDRMTGAMKHRGPDGISKYVEGPIGLGFCKLATTAEASRQDQPIIGGDGRFILVFDGWIENYDELVADLTARGEVLRTRDDAEIVMRCFERWGEGMIERLFGDFAIAVWDQREERLFCARDRMGHRPFIYFRTDRTFLFATDVAAILSMAIERRADQATLAEYLTASWHTNAATFLEGISRLEPASSLSVHQNGVHSSRYWLVERKGRLIYKSETDYAHHHQELLDRTVLRASRTNAPLGFDVSGGVDSSSVFAVATKLLRSGALRAPELAAFTIIFPDDPSADESALTAKLAQHLGARIERVLPTSKPYAWFASTAGKQCEFPGFPNSVVSTGLKEAASRRGARVHFTGAGGDELFSDYGGERGYYREDLASLRLINLARWVREDLRDFGYAQTGRWLASRVALPPAVRHRLVERAHRKSMVGVELRDLLSPNLSVALRERIAAAGALHGSLHPLQSAASIMAIELEERAASMFSLDLRHPLRSTVLLEYALSLPSRLLVKGRRTKYLHKLAMTGIMPSEVLSLGNKASFASFTLRSLMSLLPATGDRDWYVAGGLQELTRPFQGAERTQGFGRYLWALGGFVGSSALFQHI